MIEVEIFYTKVFLKVEQVIGKFYWSNGKVSEEGKYKAWRKDGVWKKYREDGSLDTIIKYDNGRLLSEKWQ